MPLALNSEVVFERFNGAPIMEVPRDAATILFRKHAIVDQSYDQLPMFSLQSVGNSGVASFMNFTAPEHILQPRRNACSWLPKGKIGTKQTSFSITPVEVDMEQCPDAFYGNCWERIFGPGIDINNLMGTEAGRKIADELLRLVYEGLGNSTHELLEFGQHPIIDYTENNAWSPVAAEKWADYKNQQDTLGGRITMIDQLKTDGLDNANVDIDSYVDATGAFTGDVFDFLEALINARPAEFEIAEDSPNGMIKGVIEMDKVSFAALGAQLLDRFTTIPDTWKLFVMGENGQMRLRNYLFYNGYAIMPQTSWSKFDAITGTKTRRALLSYPGVHGIGYDVPDLKEYGGIGLRMQQHNYDQRLKGLISLYTGYKIGYSLLDYNFFVNASTTIFPPAQV